MRTVASFPGVVLELLPSFVPYAIVLAGFGVFVIWNGGIVLGASLSVRARSISHALLACPLNAQYSMLDDAMAKKSFR